MSEVETNAVEAPPAATLQEVLKDRFMAALDAAMQRSIDHAGSSDAITRSESVRRIRKATKAVRAMLPLLAEAAPAESLSGAHRVLSDAASLLSPIRDRDAVLATIERLLGKRSGARVDHVRATLAAVVVPPDGERKGRELEDLLVVRASSMLAALAASAQPFRFDLVTSDLVAETMTNGWRELRRRTRDGWIAGGVEDAHAIRKLCSRLSLQLSFVEQEVPRSLRQLRKSLRVVTTSLGDEHDLAMLAERISLERSRFPSDEFVASALDLCRRAGERLREQAGAAVDATVVLRPRAFNRRLRAGLS